VDKNFRGKGIGFRMVNRIINDFSELNFYAEVVKGNKNSKKIFIKNHFKNLETNKNYITFQKLKNE
jgi:RimJ/RimL family protein N-acetyltransferase